jgi:threonine aldolase
MHFTSDNAAGASPRILAAIAEANAGFTPSYGADPWMDEVSARLSAIFEREITVFLVTTGTAANALALATLTPPYGQIICHAEAHVFMDECGAVEMASAGARLHPVAGASGKLAAAAIAPIVERSRGVHSVKPSTVTITQATEQGTLYAIDEIAAIGVAARAAGLALHMDGARFANALVAGNASPADMTWRAGVDVLTFGATKNGCLMGEAVIFFDADRAGDFAYRRKRAGQLVSKGRLLSAQLRAYLADDHWVDLARHANAMAAKLATGLVEAGLRLANPAEANEVFPIVPHDLAERLRAGGARFYEWPTDSLAPGVMLADNEVILRFVASFATTAEDVDALLALVRTA